MHKNPNFVLKYSFSCAAFFGSRDSIVLFTSSIETGVKGNVLAKQLLDLIKFMLRMVLSIIPEIVFSSRERVCVEKLCCLAYLKLGFL